MQLAHQFLRPIAQNPFDGLTHVRIEPLCIQLPDDRAALASQLLVALLADFQVAPNLARLMNFVFHLLALLQEQVVAIRQLSRQFGLILLQLEMFERLPQGRLKLPLLVQRLRQIAVHLALIDGLNHDGQLAYATQNHAHDARMALPNAAKQRQAIHPRHAQIRHHHLHVHLFQQDQRLFSARGNMHRIRLLDQITLQRIQKERFVIDKQNGGSAHGSGP